MHTHDVALRAADALFDCFANASEVQEAHAWHLHQIPKAVLHLVRAVHWKHVLYVSQKIEKIESAGKLLGNKDYRAYFLI